MEGKYKITYNTSKEKAFVIHLPNKKVLAVKMGNTTTNPLIILKTHC
jgi:hypothetical protein